MIGVSTRHSHRGLGLCVCILVLGACSGRREAPQPELDHVTKGKEMLVGDALLSLLRARAYGGDFDTAIVEVLRLQCAGSPLPPGLEFRPEDIAKMVPLEHLAHASLAFCGAFVLDNGAWAVAPAFRDIVKPYSAH